MAMDVLMTKRKKNSHADIFVNEVIIHDADMLSDLSERVFWRRRR